MKIKSAPLMGIVFITCAVALFATLDATMKFVGSSVPLLMALWFRYTFQAVVTTVPVLRPSGVGLLRTAHLLLHGLRSSLLIVSIALAYFSLQHMPLAEFTAIAMVTPLVITVIASTRFGERVSPLRWLLTFAGFIGAIVIIRPSGHVFSPALFLPIAFVATTAWFQLLTSRMAKTENQLTMLFYTGWLGTAVTSLALPFVWTWLPTWTLWVGVLLLGVVGTLGQFALNLAYTRAPASALAPFLYGQIGFALVAGWIVFSDFPDYWSLVGIGMICLCGGTSVWLTARENQAVTGLPATRAV